jgi:hypothetical protein
MYSGNFVMAFPEEQDMRSACRKYCLEAIELSEKLIKLSQDTHYDCDDDNCLVFSGIILDSASKIHQEAEKRLNKIEAQDHSMFE